MISNTLQDSLKTTYSKQYEESKAQFESKKSENFYVFELTGENETKINFSIPVLSKKSTTLNISDYIAIKEICKIISTKKMSLKSIELEEMERLLSQSKLGGSSLSKEVINEIDIKSEQYSIYKEFIDDIHDCCVNYAFFHFLKDNIFEAKKKTSL
jgi:hypothetical protein